MFTFSKLKLFAVSGTTNLESNALKGKLLEVLKNDNLRLVAKGLEAEMYIFDNLYGSLGRFKEKGKCF
jgi:hypothetical protein